MKILIIDDEEALAQTLKLTLEEQLPGDLVIIHHDQFDTAYERVKTESPDAVILDIFEGDTNDDRGTDVGQKIWDRHFCPLVIYTARPQEEHERLAERSPFIKLCPKRRGADKEVAGYIEGFAEHIRTVNTVRDDILDTLRDSLKHVCNVIWKATENGEERLQLIERVTRRRVAASLDFAANAPTDLHAWEQFIYPPIHRGDLLTGDILLELSSDPQEPTSYRVVLTPSCDMVSRGGQVTEALVAQCQPIEMFLKGASLDNKSKLTSISAKLSLDQAGGYMALPALPTILPLMAVNLKLLDLIELKQIQPMPIEVSNAAAQSPSSTEHRYRRVASVDSPFRERIAWAYVQISGRPGMPDVAYAKFAEQIQVAVKPSGGGS